MKRVKNWPEEKYDNKQTILEFIAYHVNNMESASSILRRVREARPDLSDRILDLSDKELKRLVEKYL